MLENLDKATTWKTPEDVFDWWLYGNRCHNEDLDGQLEL